MTAAASPGEGPARRAAVALASALLVMAVGVLDLETGAEISFSIFYLLPVSLAAWKGGRAMGVLVSLLAGFTWLAADALAGQVYSRPWIPWWNMSIRTGIFILNSILLARLARALADERALARSDSLTGVANGRAFYALLAAAVDGCRRAGTPFSLLYVDLDDFKAVNDSLGHQAGDELLKQVAALLQSEAPSGSVARLGGDEFAVLLPGADREQASRVLDLVTRGMASRLHGPHGRVTCSVGAVTYRQTPDDLDEIVRLADDLMYRVKTSGKDSVRHETWERSLKPTG